MIIYLSYPPGTEGHPPNLRVQLKLVRGEDWHNPELLISTFGGQGTINVNSWATRRAALRLCGIPGR